MKTLPRGADCVPRFCPYLFFCVFYRLEVYSVAYMRLGDLLVSSGIITGVFTGVAAMYLVRAVRKIIKK